MLFAYVDESGNVGAPVNGGTHMYSLGCVLLDADQWPVLFEKTLEFRRRLRDAYGVPIRAEIKAQYLIRGTGPLTDLRLSPAVRQLIFRAHLDVLSSLPSVRAFGVVIDKRQAPPARCLRCFDLAWEALLQRLERTSTKEGQAFMIHHDEGADDAVRRWVRRSRRHLTAGSAFGLGSVGNNPARMLVDDPVPRNSKESYFIQIADLVAYAAFRYQIAPSPAVGRVCPQDMWLRIGAATHTAVASLKSRSAPGIVLRSC